MKKRRREPNPLLPALASATGPALIKYLASCSTSVRSQSLRLIHSWLASHSQSLSEWDIKRLWKGIFYSLWHADKASNQAALIDRLASLFLSLHPPISLEFFRGFLQTLRREWPGIDRLRLDKFYLLIRRFVKALFELMRMRNWDVDVLTEYFRVLQSDALMADDKTALQGSGVNYHVVSVFLEELKAVGGFPARIEVVDAVLRPFLEVLMRCEDKILLGKVKTCLFDEFLRMGKDLLSKKKMGMEFDEKDGDTLLGVVALRMGFSGRLYVLGSSPDCVPGNRKVVLGLHSEFLKLENDLVSSGVEIVEPDYRYDVEMPPLIAPMNFDRITDKQRRKKKMKPKKKSDDDDSDRVNGDGNVRLISSFEDEIDGEAALSLNQDVISNLREHFDKFGAEIGTETDEDSDSDSDSFESSLKNSKQKRMDSDHCCPNENGMTTSSDKSVKRVRFSMKSNLIWKPQNPLPPESLRLPPSVMPRGSALKKGVLPGPVVEIPDVEKKVKQKKGKKKKKKFKK
ncbi:uncharacterized protein LOC127258944 [Andrographis paniculata]|uniref:uncharacterized protein LOC127258944 n=1 Tax=Andrographis paniculata TaxID=175694 RepID=UPI0021E7BA98|nr:uncharacterized protein LOC127258944 [Andrographis paniculata]